MRYLNSAEIEALRRQGREWTGPNPSRQVERRMSQVLGKKARNAAANQALKEALANALAQGELG